MAKIAVPHFEMNHPITLIIEMFNKTIQYIQKKKKLQKRILQHFRFSNSLTYGSS